MTSTPVCYFPYNVFDTDFIVLSPFPGKKKELNEDQTRLSSEKESGIELLSRSQICSTIVAGPLIDRVRDGNVSCKPAIDTGKKGIKMQMEGEAFMWLKCG